MTSGTRECPWGRLGGTEPQRGLACAPIGGTPFVSLDRLVTLPVRVGDVEARFVPDTGIGPTVLTERLARAVGCAPNGETLTGKRMSGQEVGARLADAPAIAVGPYVPEGRTCGASRASTRRSTSRVSPSSRRTNQT